MATMASLRRRHGNWYELHDAVDCCVVLINCASIVNTRRSTMHDKWRRAVYYYCCVVIVVGGGGIFIIVICLDLLLKRCRDRNIRWYQQQTKTNNVLTTRMLRRRQWHYRCNYNSTMVTMALMRSRRRWYHGRPSNYSINGCNAMAMEGWIIFYWGWAVYF
jgi:hypothetical protein